MKKMHFYIFTLFAIAVLLLFSSFVTGNGTLLPDLNKTFPIQLKIKSLAGNFSFGDIPLYFIRNRGQVSKTARFYAKTPDYTLWVTKEGLVFDSIRIQKAEDRSQKGVSNFTKSSRDVSRLLFVGANKNVEISSLDPQKLEVNYFKGNDKSKWVGAIPTSGAVIYKEIYKNIDLKVYGIGKQIEYDWIVHPGGNPADIRFEYKDVEGITITKTGDLDITTQFGKLIHKKPFAYQGKREKGKGKSGISEISSNFKKINKNSYGFTVGIYDKTKELIIDPVVLAYSSYLGGTSLDRGMAMTADNNGYLYITGRTASTDFPTLNQYQGDQTGVDVFLTKIDTNSSGASSLLYSTYIGGNSTDMAYGVAVDSSGYVYIGGVTWSSDYPTLNQYMTDQGATDAIVSKFDTTQSGTSSLLYSTYLGGGSDDFSYAIAIDNNGYAYITGYTASSNFPLVNQYQTAQMSDDAFISKINTNGSGASSLVYSTYLGGLGIDQGWGIAVDSNGYAYITGHTASATFPTLNQYQTDQAGNDIFISKIDPAQSGASSLLYSTYLGGSSGDAARAICVDNNEVVYVTGFIDSSDFPVLNGYQTTLQGSVRDACVSKIDTTQSGTSCLLYSSYLGGDDDDLGYGIIAANDGKVVVSGHTTSTDFPTLHQYQTDQTQRDAFVSRFDTMESGASSLIWSTYLGGNDYDASFGVDVDSSGYIYVGGYTESSNFPLLNQYQSQQGSDDAWVTKLYMEYTVTSSVTGGNGTVSPASQNVVETRNAAVNIDPDPGYVIASITDNSTNVPVSSPYTISNVQEDHTVVVSFEPVTYRISASVQGGNGTISPATQNTRHGDNTTINIYPDAGYKIGSITDNGVSVPVTNPYVIIGVQENHTVVIEFAPDSYPPELGLTGTRKTDRAWIITMEYTELNISIVEHPVNPVELSRSALLKSSNGQWQEIETYTTSGAFTFIDKNCEKGKPASYKLVSFFPDGRIAVETGILTL